jgi:asparagine synthase (glutamine-hydrolysing)
MCGISGFINFKNQMVERHKLEKMLTIQNHRGPDSQGIYYNHYVGFAHNRLSLLDLTASGNQPFEDENFVLTFNGEIYNYLELKKELPEFNYTSTADTAVLFHALRHWGVEKTVNKINGMFAFSWYDKTTKDLVLVRDRIGIKPLYYALDNQSNYWFASEIKAVLAVNDFKPNSIKILYSALASLEKSRYETAWDDIKFVKPGTFITISEKGIKETEYYTLSSDINESEFNRLNNLDFKSVIDEFEHLFDLSVKKMAVSDAPMGAFVSGGIDSSLIALHGSKYSPDLKLFTANIIGKYSEFDGAKLLAKTINKELFDYKYEKEMALCNWAKVTWHYETPIIAHFNALPFSNVAKLAREHNVKAVLTGEGADELFLGYPKLLTQRYDTILKSPYTFLNFIYDKVPKLTPYLNKTGGSQDLLGLFEQASYNFNRQITREDSIINYGFLPKNQQLEQYKTKQMMNEHIVSLLHRNDRMGMIHSIESRFPFLDEDIVKFSMNLPNKFKISRINNFYNYKHPFLMDKAIVRKLADRELPKSLTRKKKNGFPSFGLRYMHVKPEFFENGTVSQCLQLDKRQLKYMCGNFANYSIALLASVEIWAKLFIEAETIDEVTNLINTFITIG